MMASRFTKAFQLIALVLAFSVAQVYVMAGPIRSNTDPRTPVKTSASEPKAEPVVADSSLNKVTTATASAESHLLTPEAAAEKMALRFGSKTTLNRIFSKENVAARLATGNTFLKASTSGRENFKVTSARTNAAQTSGQSDDDDGDTNGSRSTWIAVGVIAAVLTIAVIGLRHDRHTENQ